MAVLLTGYNAVLPALFGSDDVVGQKSATAFLSRVFVFVGGTALGLTAALRGDIVELLLGHSSALAERTMLLFCGVGLANLVVHGGVWLLMATGHHGALARAVALELPLNLALTVVLVAAWGAIGAAVATLTTVVVLDLAIFPVIARPRLRQSLVDLLVRNGLVPATIGVAVAAAASRMGALASGPWLHLVIGSGLTAVVGAGVGMAFLGPQGRAGLARAITKASVATEPGDQGVAERP